MSDKIRLIDANALKAEFTGNFQDEYPPSQIKAIIDSRPTIKAESVRHGHWIETADEYYLMMSETSCPPNKLPYFIEGTDCACSLCGSKTDIRSDNLKHWGWCPFCGAKMDGGDNYD